MWKVLCDALLDALLLLPFLFVLYIAIELLEHKTAVGRPARALSGKCAPLIGSAAGLVPLCGFSVMASKLYRRKFITLGTLIAVLISTSDEALLVLAISSVSAPKLLLSVLALIGSKFVLATGVGYAIELIMRRRAPQPLPARECAEAHTHEDAHEEKEPSVCEHKHESKWTLYLLSPILHALQVTAFVFAFNLLFGGLFAAIGEERVIGFLQGAGRWYQPLFTALVALVPNCASSVALAEVYTIGGIGFGALLGGLVTNTGLGILVLFRDVKKWRESLIILLLMLLLGVLFGYAASAIEFFI